MPTLVTCERCGARYRIPEGVTGKKSARCKRCGAEIRFGEPDSMAGGDPAATAWSQLLSETTGSMAAINSNSASAAGRSAVGTVGTAVATLPATQAKTTTRPSAPAPATAAAAAPVVQAPQSQSGDGGGLWETVFGGEQAAKERQEAERRALEEKQKAELEKVKARQGALKSFAKAVVYRTPAWQKSKRPPAEIRKQQRIVAGTAMGMLVSLFVSLIHPALLAGVSTAYIVAGVAGLITSAVWGARIAFRDSVKRGLAYLLVPGYAPYYAFVRFHAMWKPVALCCLSVVLLVSGPTVGYAIHLLRYPAAVEDPRMVEKRQRNEQAEEEVRKALREMQEAADKEAASTLP